MKQIINTLATFLFLIFANLALAQGSYQFLISNSQGNSVQRYAADGTFLGNFVKPASGGLLGTQDMLYHPDGTLLVTGINNTTVKQYNGSTGEYIGDFSSGVVIAGPTKLTLGPDSLIYVTQWNSITNDVVRLNLDGSFHSKWTAGGPVQALGQEWDSEGNLYVAAFGTGSNGVVRKFDSAGNDLGDFITSAVLQGPTEIQFLQNGDLLVQDWQAANVRRYDSVGNYIGIFASGIGQTEGFAFMDDGSILMPDWASDAIQHVDSAGNSLGIFASGNGMNDPNGILRIAALPVGLEERSPISNLRIFPSHGRGPRNIEFELDQMKEVRFRVIDVFGKSKTVFHGHYSSGIHRIHLSDDRFTPGSYLLEASGSGMNKTLRFMVTE